MEPLPPISKSPLLVGCIEVTRCDFEKIGKIVLLHITTHVYFAAEDPSLPCSLEYYISEAMREGNQPPGMTLQLGSFRVSGECCCGT